MEQEENNSTSFALNARLPALCMVQPTEGQGYMIVARDLLQGVEALSTFQNISPRSCAMIAAHALECTLKAFLSHTAPKVPHHHDIIALWHMAYKEKTLDIPKVPPDWVEVLASGHWPNFYFRYQEGQDGTVVHFGSTPALIPMSVDLKKLFEKVELAIKGDHNQ